MDLLDVHWLPGHMELPTVPVFEVHARVDTFLGGHAGGIQSEALVHIDLLIHAEMVT